MLGINTNGIPPRESIQIQKTTSCVTPGCKTHSGVRAGMAGGIRRNERTQHFNVTQTVSGITVRSASNCVHLSKHIESCLKMVLSLHINDTTQRNVELNQRQLQPGAPASTGCPLFNTPCLTGYCSLGHSASTAETAQETLQGRTLCSKLAKSNSFVL